MGGPVQGTFFFPRVFELRYFRFYVCHLEIGRETFTPTYMISDRQTDWTVRSRLSNTNKLEKLIVGVVGNINLGAGLQYEE